MNKVAHVEIPARYTKLGKKVSMEKGDLHLTACYDHGKPRGWILSWEPVHPVHFGSPAGGLRGPVIRRMP